MAAHLQGFLGGIVHDEANDAEQDTDGAVQVVDEYQRLFVTHLNGFLVLGVVDEKLRDFVKLRLIWLVVIFDDPRRVVFVVLGYVHEPCELNDEGQ